MASKPSSAPESAVGAGPLGIPAAPAAARSAVSPTLSVVIPAYNEQDTIVEVLRQVQAVPVDKEIIIVDDGSTDRTREILRDEVEGKMAGVKVIFQPQNMGKGMALRTGFKHAEGKIVIIQDADLEYDPADYLKLIQPILEGKAQVVYGSRFLDGASDKGTPVLYQIARRLLSISANVLYGTRITDEATCYKVFEARLIKEMPLNCLRFEFCPEVTAKIAKRGIRIHELPIRYIPRGREAGKKIGWKDAVQAFLVLLKYRFMN